jgi:Gas vesicle protein
VTDEVATRSGGSLADVLERVLDKGIVIVGDITVSVVEVELLTLRVRLFVASAQTAQEMGMDWWTNDPYFSPNRRELANDSGHGGVRVRDHPGVDAGGADSSGDAPEHRPGGL